MYTNTSAGSSPAPSKVEDLEQVSFTNLSELALSILDEFDAADFRKVERLIAAFKRQARNPSGFPRIRPPDCSLVTEALLRVAKAHEHFLSMGDPIIAGRLDDLFSAFADTDIGFYPSELFKLRIFQASARLAFGNVAGAEEILAPYSDRDYLFEGDWLARTEFARLDGHLRLLRGDNAFPFLTMRRAAKIADISRPKAAFVFEQLASLIALGPRHEFHGRVAALFVWLCSRIYLSVSRGAGTFLKNWRFSSIAKLAALCGGVGLAWVDPNMLRRTGSNQRKRNERPEIIVTRAMGGIGDFLMMTPAFRALSKRYGQPISLVIPKRFFPIFEGNQHVRLFDIEGPPIELDRFDRWYDLTVCPAGRYESARRPDVRAGRVELFARGLGVSERELDRHGWNLEACLNEQQRRFADDFISTHFTGSRPILGFQPYSRDTYKDLPDGPGFVGALAKSYDLIVFHHESIPTLAAEGVVSTAGLSLSQSLALVYRLDAMVCIDSAMLHAAAAFDVPVVAMFGPTPGSLFTRHHKNAVLPKPAGSFVCRPCWRNEDMKCLVTGKTGHSACMKMFDLQEIALAVQQVISPPSTEKAPTATGTFADSASQSTRIG